MYSHKKLNETWLLLGLTWFSPENFDLLCEKFIRSNFGLASIYTFRKLWNVDFLISHERDGNSHKHFCIPTRNWTKHETYLSRKVSTSLHSSTCIYIFKKCCMLAIECWIIVFHEIGLNFYSKFLYFHNKMDSCSSSEVFIQSDFHCFLYRRIQSIEILAIVINLTFFIRDLHLFGPSSTFNNLFTCNLTVKRSETGFKILSY